jgi:uncharacterized protein
MLKILLIAIAVWLLINIIKRYSNSLNEPKKPPETTAEDMVRCSYCGVHLPKSDSFFIKNQYYCCEAHSKQST